MTLEGGNAVKGTGLAGAIARARKQAYPEGYVSSKDPLINLESKAIVDYLNGNGGGGGGGGITSVNGETGPIVVLTTDDIPDGVDKRYCTDAQKTIIGNTSGSNTGDETQATIKSKLGAASVSVDGYLTSADWSTFNGKQNAISVADTTAVDLTLNTNQISANFGTSASTVMPMQKLGSPANYMLSDWLNAVQSSGRISGLTITAHSPANGTIDISSGKVVIKSANANMASTVFFDFEGQASLALTDEVVNYIYFDYNSGTPEVKATTDRTIIHDYDHFTIGRVFRSGNDVDITNSGTNIYNHHRRLHNKEVLKYGIDHISGAEISQYGTSGLQTTDGVWYIGFTRLDTIAQQSGVGGSTITAFYRAATPGTWTKVTGITNLGITQYDDGTGTLATLSGASKCGVYWVFVCLEGDIYVVYGQAEYNTLANAQASKIPASLPSYVNGNARLAARVIFQKSIATFLDIGSAWDTLFVSSVATDHNLLAGLQGGATGDYYHLTGAQSTLVSNISGWTSFAPTMTLVGGTGNTVPVYSTNNGRYCKMNNTVFVRVDLHGDGGSEGAGTGVVNIALPVSTGSSHFSTIRSIGTYANSTTYGEIYGYIATGVSSTITLRKTLLTGGLTGDDQNNASRAIYIEFWYEI